MKYEEKLFGYEVPEIRVTDEDIKSIKKNPQKYSNCDARVKVGLVYTDKEREKYIKDSLKRTLPRTKVKIMRFGQRKH